MARAMRMPTSNELPNGPVRNFVEALHMLYRQARRPSLRRIGAEAGRSGAGGTASTETIRRMLHGDTIPSNWGTVEAVLLGLCNIAGKNPDDLYYHSDDNDPTTIRQELEFRWNNALDGYPSADPGGHLPPDPWDTKGPGGYSDEPPF